MHIIFFTRSVNARDPRTGFVVEWLRMFGKFLDSHDDYLDILTWQASGTIDLPVRSSLYALRSTSSEGTLTAFMRGVKVFFSRVPRCDAIIIHQHPVYVIMAWPFVRLYRKKMYLWYVHKHVDIKLKIAVHLCDGVFTASQESFRLSSKTPLHIVGHGINSHLFAPVQKMAPTIPHSQIPVVSFGRISPSKKYEDLIEAMTLLTPSERARFRVELYGSPALAPDVLYHDTLQDMIAHSHLTQSIQLMGPLAHIQVAGVLSHAHIFVNLSCTGSLDKAVLEAMACGVLVITSNEAFIPLFKAIQYPYFVAPGDSRALADALLSAAAVNDESRRVWGTKLRNIVVEKHNLETTIDTMLTIIRSEINCV